MYFPVHLKIRVNIFWAPPRKYVKLNWSNCKLLIYFFCRFPKTGISQINVDLNTFHQPMVLAIPNFQRHLLAPYRKTKGTIVVSYYGKFKILKWRYKIHWPYIVVILPLVTYLQIGFIYGNMVGTSLGSWHGCWLLDPKINTVPRF